MSEYMFGVYKGPIRLGHHYDAVEAIAKAHGATVVESIIPGTGYQRWFSSPNMGDPFDRDRAAAVRADLTEAGLAWVLDEPRAKPRPKWTANG